MSSGVQLPSERSFGVVFTIFFAIVGLWPLLVGGTVRLWGLVLAGIFLLLALVKPEVLRPLNRLWAKFGLLLHTVMSPILLGILFFGLFTPMGVVRRLMGKDGLRLRFDEKADSYWQKREDPGPPPESMKQQF
ncbi:MAG: hypothetical protein HQL53_00700 [Magnetococcales bacterium]|nr:hypothetical protein [Magnetococcales bacterium]